MSFYEKHKKGIIGTVIYHVIILLLLIFLGFFTPLPLPGEEGILVNFGNSENGFGDREPSPARRNPEPVQPQPQKKQQPEQKKATPPPATPPPVSEPEPAEEVAMTQDYEKTAAIEAAEKKKREEAEKKKKLEQERRRQEELERQRQAEIERQKQAEIERQRQAELERQRQLEAERKKREEEQRKINEINSRAKGAFGNSGTGTGGEGKSDGKSQGVTFPGGNQGVPTGDANAGKYGPGGNGSGDQGSGPSLYIEGRSVVGSLPKPEYLGDDAGVVVVKIIVDKNGNVRSAEPGVRGPGNMKTTLINKLFWDEAKKAALKAKFNVDPNAAAEQQGFIAYKFTY